MCADSRCEKKIWIRVALHLAKGPVAPTFSALTGGVALQVASWKVLRYKGVSQLDSRLSRYNGPLWRVKTLHKFRWNMFRQLNRAQISFRIIFQMFHTTLHFGIFDETFWGSFALQTCHPNILKGVITRSILLRTFVCHGIRTQLVDQFSINGTLELHVISEFWFPAMALCGLGVKELLNLSNCNTDCSCGMDSEREQMARVTEDGWIWASRATTCFFVSAYRLSLHNFSHFEPSLVPFAHFLHMWGDV